MTITEPNILMTFLLMGLVVYLIRIAGYWVAGRITISKKIEIWLGYLPGCILMALVAPAILSASFSEMLGAVVTAVAMWRSRSLLISMVAGIGTVAIVNLF